MMGSPSETPGHTPLFPREYSPAPGSLFPQDDATRAGSGWSEALTRFEAIVLPHLDAAFTLARYLVRDAQDAEDVVQDACLRALRHFEGFRGDDASARSWLLAIVRNTAYTALKRRRVDAQGTEFDEAAHSEAVAEDHPEAALLRSDARESLARALDHLGPEFREVIVLRELQGMSYKEISDIAGVPVGTVMSRLSRARQRLQEALTAAEER
jgi:RNA polymerase sigma-70 factor (ECF subfamily)